MAAAHASIRPRGRATQRPPGLGLPVLALLIAVVVGVASGESIVEHTDADGHILFRVHLDDAGQVIPATVENFPPPDHPVIPGDRRTLEQRDMNGNLMRRTVGSNGKVVSDETYPPVPPPPPSGSPIPAPPPPSGSPIPAPPPPSGSPIPAPPPGVHLHVDLGPPSLLLQHEHYYDEDHHLHPLHESILDDHFFEHDLIDEHCPPHEERDHHHDFCHWKRRTSK